MVRPGRLPARGPRRRLAGRLPLDQGAPGAAADRRGVRARRRPVRAGDAARPGADRRPACAICATAGWPRCCSTWTTTTPPRCGSTSGSASPNGTPTCSSGVPARAISARSPARSPGATRRVPACAANLFRLRSPALVRSATSRPYRHPRRRRHAGGPARPAPAARDPESPRRDVREAPAARPRCRPRRGRARAQRLRLRQHRQQHRRRQRRRQRVRQPPLDCASGTLSWDGSSAQKTAVTQWIQQYQNQCSDASINYQGQGSGAGRTAFYGGQIPVAGSDASIADEDRSKADARCSRRQGGQPADGAHPGRVHLQRPGRQRPHR